MNNRLQIIFFVALFLQCSSYFMPFLEKDLGFEFFQSGIEVLLSEGLLNRNFHLFYAFFSPILSLPLMIWSFHKSRTTSNYKILGGILLLTLCIPVLLSVVFVGIDLTRFSIVDLSGFVIWVFSFLCMYGLHIKKLSKRELDIEADMSEHLIEE